MPAEEILRPLYTGDEDLSVWLEGLDECDAPRLFPLWPDDFPNYLAVYLTAEDELGVPQSRQAMLYACCIGRLWFCRVPKAEFDDHTTLE